MSVDEKGQGGDKASSGRLAKGGGLLKRLGLGIISGAADDDPSAIGTYASAGAKLGPSFLWTAPATLPMMYVVVYLASKLGQVSGLGLFDVIRERYPKWLLYSVLVGVLIGNTIEAAADLGGMAAALNLLVPIPIPLLVVGMAALIFGLQLLGSYETIRDTLKWLALALFAYAVSAFLAKPDWGEVLRGTLVPTIHFNREFLSLVVAVIGTSLSAYLFTWQSNVEVEEKIAEGKTTVRQRRGATDEELSATKRDVLVGMIFSNLIMYFIILATGATLHKAGQTDIESAAQAAAALKPIAGEAAGLLFAAGVVGVGFLAVPVMTTGAAYDLVQAFGGKASLHAKPREAKLFYAAIAGFTAIAVGLNFLGFNPMKALVWSGIVQGFSTPVLLLLIMLMTNSRAVMGDRVNGTFTNVLGWITTGIVFLASGALLVSWVIGD